MPYKINTMTVKPVNKITGEENPKATFYLPNSEELDKLVDEIHGGSVLDIGCGNGVLAYMLAKKGVKVVGVDPNSDLILSAKKLYRHKNLILEFGDSKTAIKKYKGKVDVVMNSWMPVNVNLTPDIRKIGAKKIIYIRYMDDKTMTGKQYGLFKSYSTGFRYKRIKVWKNHDGSFTEIQMIKF